MTFTKKYIAFAAAAAFAVTASLSGCNKPVDNNSEPNVITSNLTTLSEITSADIATETAPTEPSFSETEQLYPENDETSDNTESITDFSDNERILIDLLNSIKDGEGANAICADYDFFDDFTLNDYSYVKAGDAEYGEKFDVTFNISGSSTEYFPDGTSLWRICIEPDAASYISEFFPLDVLEEREELIDKTDELFLYSDGTLHQAAMSAVNFTKCTNLYEADESSLAALDNVNIHSIYHALPVNPCDENSRCTPQKLADAINDTFGMSITAEKVEETFSDILVDGELDFSGDGHGGSWLYPLMTAYEETDSELIIDIDYYGDTGYFICAKSCEYTLELRDDGGFKLKSIVNTYDSGYPVAVGSI